MAEKIEVVAALIVDGDRFLACQRPEHKTRGMMWEFPGGKIEPGETGQEALVREIQEELGILIHAGEVFADVTHHYDDITVHLVLYCSEILSGIPQKLEHRDIHWFTTAEADPRIFCPADQVFLKILTKRKAEEGNL